jgi:thiamine-monophosphate kinase
MGELELIEQIRSSATKAGIRRNTSLTLGIGDDCAILRPPPGHEILVTTDFSLEGRHFRRDWHPPESVGHRALARGLSDLAAMGARPLAAFLSLALPAEMLATRTGRRWVEDFFAGLHALAQQHGVPLAGGDTSESPSGLVLADIVLVGSAPTGRALRRSGARIGDALYVTGQLGGSAAELAEMEQRAAQTRPSMPRNHAAKHPHLFPQPRIDVGLTLLRRRFASAAIDLSDGLSTDLAHLCRESCVGADVVQSALPIHPLAIQAGPARALDLALNGGEDYELLFTASPKVRVPRSIAGVPITRIGHVVAGATFTLVDPSGARRPLEPAGWEHFNSSPAQHRTDTPKQKSPSHAKGEGRLR